MADAIIENLPKPLPAPSRSPVVRGIDGLSDFAGAIAAFALAAMTSVVVFEVVSRYVFN
jgi:TRAP-type mannitol/chloroaromatic compound transport system permease small subunit